VEPEGIAISGLARSRMARSRAGIMYKDHLGTSKKGVDAIIAHSAHSIGATLVSEDRRCRERLKQLASSASGESRRLVGRLLLSPEIRRAITVDARVKPNYAGIRVPVLAIDQAQRPFEEVAADFEIGNEQERAALRQQYAATRAMYRRWQQDLLAAVPTARIVELPGANLFMFLSNEADIIRELRVFASSL